MDYQLTQTGAEVQVILNQAPEVVAVSGLNSIDAVGNYYVTDGDGKARGYLICSQSGPVGSPFYLQTYLHDGAIYSRSGNALPLTGEWVNGMGGVTVLSIRESVDAAAVYADIHAGKQIVLNYDGSYLLLSSYIPGQSSGTPIVTMLEFVDSHFDPTDGVETATYFVWRNSEGWDSGETALATTDQVRAKQNVIDDLSTIRSGAAAGATAYQKPGTGIPKTDLASPVQTSLGKADTSVQPAALTPIQSALSVIESLIPGTASAQNQLADKDYVDTHSTDIDVDDELSTTSENPVQNKVVTTALNDKQATISDLSTIRSGAAAGATAVQPAAMNTALAGKQDTISTVNVTVDNNTGTPSGSASVSGSTLSLSFQNLKGATGAQGPQGIQGVQGVQGPKGDTGVTGDASSLAIIHGIDKTSTYTTTDVCGADAAQALLNEIEGGFYY